MVPRASQINVAIGRRSRRPSDTRSMALSADWIGRSVTGVVPESTIRTPPRGRIALTPSQRSVRILICQWPVWERYKKSRSELNFLIGPIGRHEPHPVIDEGGKPVARSVIVDRTIGNMFMPLLRTGQFHAMRPTNEPTIHHGVRHFRMELQRIARP